MTILGIDSFCETACVGDHVFVPSRREVDEGGSEQHQGDAQMEEEFLFHGNELGAQGRRHRA